MDLQNYGPNFIILLVRFSVKMQSHTVGVSAQYHFLHPCQVGQLAAEISLCRGEFHTLVPRDLRPIRRSTNWVG